MKKVILFVIDAFSPRVLLPAIERGELPTFGRIIERGGVNPNCCSVFPSITHACLSSIATGEYPIEHGVIGTFWYENDKQEICYYGAQPWVVLNQGINKFLEDLLSKWNEERLKAPTIFERIERAGLKAACINHLVYRGDTVYDVHRPTAFKLIPGIQTTGQLKGPSIMMLGDFKPLNLPDGRTLTRVAHGLPNKFGLNDLGALGGLGALAGARAFPDFTLAYFPDNDIQSHAKGPQNAIGALKTLDWGFEALFERMGGLDAVLEEFTILMTGDHAQVEMNEGETKGGIVLEEVLSDFRIIDAGSPLDCEHDLLVAPNLRTAFIYCDECDSGKHKRIVKALLRDDRIDQVLWQADTIQPGERGFKVVTADRGDLHFWQGGDGDLTAVDDYGCPWSWKGSQTVLDFKAVNGKIVWGDYPNAFERIAAGMGPAHAGHVWATARLGYGFRVDKVKSHAGGGSHASLHRGDSLVPFVSAGLPDGVGSPDNMRIVDIAPFILKLLGVEASRLGEPRFKERMKEPAV